MEYSTEEAAFVGEVVNGQWTMDNGQWTMDNGQWTMDNGQWTMDNGQIILALQDNYRPSGFHYSPFTIYQKDAAGSSNFTKFEETKPYYCRGTWLIFHFTNKAASYELQRLPQSFNLPVFDQFA